MAKSPASPIRANWMYHAACTTQQLAGEILEGPLELDIRERLSRAIPAPASALEHIVLEGLIARAQREARQNRVRAEKPERSVPVSRQAATLLRQRYSEHWTIASLARHVGTNRFTLTTEFAREFGVGVHKYLVNVRIAAAQERLCNRDKIDAIARDVGFASRKSLYDAYKRVTGRTLADDRRRAATQS